MDKADGTLVAFASSQRDCWVGMKVIVKGIVMSSCKTAMGPVRLVVSPVDLFLHCLSLHGIAVCALLRGGAVTWR